MSEPTNFEQYKKEINDYILSCITSTQYDQYADHKVCVFDNIEKYNKVKEHVEAIELKYNQQHHKIHFVEIESGRTCRVKLSYTNVFKPVNSKKQKTHFIKDFLAENNHFSDLITEENEKSGKIKIFRKSVEKRLSIYLYNHAKKKYDTQTLNVGVGVLIFASNHFYRVCESFPTKSNRREEMPNVIRMGDQALIEMDDDIFELAQMITV